MALDGQKRGLSAAQGSKHVSEILSAADVKRVLTDEQDLQVDVDIDDYFKLAELKVGTTIFYEVFASLIHLTGLYPLVIVHSLDEQCLYLYFYL